MASPVLAQPLLLGMMRLRRTRPDLPRPVRCWGYPVTPLLFLGISLWMLAYVLLQRPWESLAGLATLASGLIVYRLSPPETSSPTHS